MYIVHVVWGPKSASDNHNSHTIGITITVNSKAYSILDREVGAEWKQNMAGGSGTKIKHCNKTWQGDSGEK